MQVIIAVADWIIAAGAIGSAIGGIGAAIGAGAAWRAALASAQASREAREALALTVKPHIEIALGQWEGASSPARARAVAVSHGPWGYGGWPATEVLIQFTLASGKQGSDSVPLLETTTDRYGGTEPYLEIEIARPGDDWPPPERDRVEVTVLFTDVRRAAFYKAFTSADLGRSESDPGSVSFLIVQPTTVTRIDGPA